jgi:hypothetical protein
MVMPAQHREVAQARPASSVVSHGVVGVAARGGPSAAGIGAGGMPDLNQVAQPRRGPVGGRLPGMITVVACQEREAEGPGPVECAGNRLTGRADIVLAGRMGIRLTARAGTWHTVRAFIGLARCASSLSVAWAVRRSVVRAACRSGVRAACRSVARAACRSVVEAGRWPVVRAVRRSVAWAACRSVAWAVWRSVVRAACRSVVRAACRSVVEAGRWPVVRAVWWSVTCAACRPVAGAGFLCTGWSGRPLHTELTRWRSGAGTSVRGRTAL